MYNNKRTFEVNPEHTAAFLENTIESVRADYDVDSLAELNKLFKKNVPLTLRKYVVAYLIREALKHDHSYRGNRFENKRNKKNETRENPREENKKSAKRQEVEEAPAAEERQPRPRVEIPEDQATTIFISIGRNRRVFPRDLVSLLINVGGLDRERIGNIKVLANYSFVQLFTEDTEKAIAALNDYEYRGRKLVVNLSRQKGEGEDEAAAESAASNAEDAMSAEDAAAYAAAEKAANNEPFGN